MTEGFADILVEKKAGVCTITLNQPKTLNALSMLMREELFVALSEAANDLEVKVIVLTGAGKSFCSGGDISTMGEFKPNQGRKRLQNVQRITRAIWTMDKPVIAAVNGYCTGAGMNIALACDLIVAGQSAKFCQAFTKIGLVPDLGGFYLLPRRVGIQRAKELVLLATMIDVDTAYEYGIVNKIAPDENLLEEAGKWAEKLAKGPGIAFALTKTLMNKSLDSDFEHALSDEAFAQDMCMMTEDFQEGIVAFKEKRKPEFKGK
jgi:2-(1,2-epoxy-1,2-dihydrophenyl)acetyl-CoA isomerase